MYLHNKNLRSLQKSGYTYNESFVDEFFDLINTIIVDFLNFRINYLIRAPHYDVCILIDTLSLLKHITCPTHIKGNTLDYVITNCEANMI